MSELQTPLLDCHRDAGAKLVEFAGWTMPVRYASETDEHHAVRERAGLFDVSHMGELHLHGAGAADFLQRLTPNDVTKLAPGRAHYSALLTPEATYIDDLLVYQLGEDDYLLVVNAANRETDLDWLRSHQPPCALDDVSDDYALIALQGPAAPGILADLTEVDLDALRYYHFVPEARVAGVPVLLSRTGYTGEDGFELYLAPQHAPGVWTALLEVGADDLLPAGLAARDTLRLEAGMALYGHEIDRTTTPYEAGLRWTVKLKQGEFVGRDVLVRQKAEGVGRKLVGLEVTGRGIARQGHAVLVDGEEVGSVCSGTRSPTLEKVIATAYVPTASAEVGTEVELQVRSRRLPAVVVPLPFYKRA
ncbi:MAG: glycine cleavage system aminomethyltransferase GcvT [Acidobacteriota bacterium]